MNESGCLICWDQWCLTHPVDRSRGRLEATVQEWPSLGQLCLEKVGDAEQTTVRLHTLAGGSPAFPILLWSYTYSIPDYLSCLLRNMYADQEATVRTGHGTTDWFQIGKGVHQGCILPPCLFNFFAEYIMWNARLDESKVRVKIDRRNMTTSDMQMTPPLWQKVKRN